MVVSLTEGTHPTLIIFKEHYYSAMGVQGRVRCRSDKKRKRQKNEIFFIFIAEKGVPVRFFPEIVVIVLATT